MGAVLRSTALAPAGALAILLAAAGTAHAAPAAAAASAKPSASALPEDHRSLARSTSFPKMEEFLDGVDGKGPVTVSALGRSRQGRSLYVVRLSHGGTPAWKVLLYAQQHGDEVSGKDALLYLVRDVARRPELLPKDVEVWLVPMVNPDGAEAGTRENGSGADLNRDHLALEQPETQALHRLARLVRPHVAVDCHEFTRDGAAWRAKGWLKWPLVTMDGFSSPVFDPASVAVARRWVDESAAVEAAAGHPFLRYWVGGVPPDEEQRPSAPDFDCALNAIGSYAGLSFIIEAAVTRGGKGPDADLGARVDAYLVLVRRFLDGGSRREEDLRVIEAARGRRLPPFLPTNVLWANPGGKVTPFPVLEAATGKTRTVPTPNMMTELVVKRSVPTPTGYLVAPAAAPAIGAALARHGIPFEKLAAPRVLRAESCTLERLERDFDDLYSRYEGRQVVTRGAARAVEAPEGSLWVPLEGESALRAAAVLEPASLYGLYQLPAFAALLGPGPAGVLPVLRVVGGAEGEGR